MVKICSHSTYPVENEELYKEYFDTFSYPLHIFQKWAIEGIVNGSHVLVTAPTGSGKSLPAEFSIYHFHDKHKKVIYCSPIKSLSNQKFSDFSQKFPRISIGIITGDLKINTDASVLIMTTEILLNKLYQIKSGNNNNNNNNTFEMDMENELGCVVFDEIHYINNEDRGHVWEQSLMLLPPHIQIIGLSATLDNPEKFADWIEHRHQHDDKPIYLVSKLLRAVPLLHYSFITVNQGIFKIIKDKTQQEEIKQLINKPMLIQDEKNKLIPEHFAKIHSMIQLFHVKQVKVSRIHVLNQVSKYLTEHEMTPAICYVFSIKQIELMSREISTNLLEFDSKVPYIAKRECDALIRTKFSNFEEYLHLPEYVQLVSLLEKGIATHHSKMLPVLREIVEIFFAKGYIKLLFATESVAIGLNLPVKTCLFTDIYKHCEQTGQRLLHSHEYVQAAGRSGRLGLDKVGHVIHLNNLFRPVETISYKNMMNGKPQQLHSKFKISFQLLLSLLDSHQDISHFTNKSMLHDDLDCKIKQLQHKIRDIKPESIETTVPTEIMEEYILLQSNLSSYVNKKRKDCEKQIQAIEEQYKHIALERIKYLRVLEHQQRIETLQSDAHGMETYLNHSLERVLGHLLETQFIEYQKEDEEEQDEYKEKQKSLYTLTLKGKIAIQLREVHGLIFTNLYLSNKMNSLSSHQLVALFSCFTNIRVAEDVRDNNPPQEDNELFSIITNELIPSFAYYASTHIENIEYDLHYDLMTYALQWCKCEDVEQSKFLLQTMAQEKDIFLGEFVKALLKINNISSEFEKVVEMTGNMELLSKLKEIPMLTLKFVVTNQSLYV